ncbi:MAG: hypothetical protein EZS28_014766 [Streblomastix strix]|uniref:Protein kinase domain-containing protein n=1 Tax=Streblomastix strix TaxID=222440 RepID=A0A5J4W4Q3_9EUKA|nr:MAG: hypothetical protein EZS28_014766 [Streblomastix strix]
MEEIQILNQEGFQVFKTLGQGAFGRVFLSYNKDIGLIAAKVMQSKVFDENEWDAAGRLQQGEPIPFIVQFKSAKNFGEYVVILMEFANLKSLDNIIKKNYALTPGTLRAIARQLFEGLRLIHSRGLVHRDIKGENLMMHCPPGSNRVIVKIADFGLVKLQGGGVQQTMLMSGQWELCYSNLLDMNIQQKRLQFQIYKNQCGRGKLSVQNLLLTTYSGIY